MIKRLVAYDFDGTLFDSPMPDIGRKIWKEKTGTEYPHIGWWGRPESLDMNVFDIKPFPSVLAQLNKDKSTPDTYVIVLTSRRKKLQPQLQAILDANSISVDKLDTKYDNSEKGDRVLRYLQEFPDLIEISVYDDRDSDIVAYKSILSQVPKHITFNIYLAENGSFALIDSNKSLNHIISEEIEKFNS